MSKNKKTGEYFAMKILKKADIIKLKQVDHVISENTILADIDHPYLVRKLKLLIKTNLGWSQGILSGFSLSLFPDGLHPRG